MSDKNNGCAGCLGCLTIIFLPLFAIYAHRLPYGTDPTITGFLKWFFKGTGRILLYVAAVVLPIGGVVFVVVVANDNYQHSIAPTVVSYTIPSITPSRDTSPTQTPVATLDTCEVVEFRIKGRSVKLCKGETYQADLRTPVIVLFIRDATLPYMNSWYWYSDQYEFHDFPGIYDFEITQPGEYTIELLTYRSGSNTSFKDQASGVYTLVLDVS